MGIFRNIGCRSEQKVSVIAAEFCNARDHRHSGDLITSDIRVVMSPHLTDILHC